MYGNAERQRKMCDAELTLKAIEANARQRSKSILNKIMECQEQGKFTQALVLRNGYDELLYVLSMLGVHKEEIGYGYE